MKRDTEEHYKLIYQDFVWMFQQIEDQHNFMNISVLDNLAWSVSYAVNSYARIHNTF